MWYSLYTGSRKWGRDGGKDLYGSWLESIQWTAWSAETAALLTLRSPETADQARGAETSGGYVQVRLQAFFIQLITLYLNYFNFFSEIQSLLFHDLRVCRRPSEMSRSGLIFHIKGHGHCWWSDNEECFETSSSVVCFNSTVCFYCIKVYFRFLLFSPFYTCFALAKICPK